MLSYRHGFHAGNFADVLKHITEILLINSMLKKDKPCCFIDTHAGAGAYSLKSEWSKKTGEYINGIAKICHNEQLKQLVPNYFNILKEINNNSENLDFYPGSPYISTHLLRDIDDITCFELHPNEYENLKYNMHFNKNCHVHNREAKEGLNALLPPKIRRGIIFIDPSYEEATDYKETIKMIKQALKDFNQAVVALWYPILGKANDQSYFLIRELQKLNIKNSIQVELSICQQDTILGMHGTGMVILNTPFQIKEQLEGILPILEHELALDNTATSKIVQLTQE